MFSGAKLVFFSNITKFFLRNQIYFCNFARYFCEHYFMINRSLVRSKVLQTLFAYYNAGDKTPNTARKELIHSFSDTYGLYCLLLDFVNSLTTYAEEQLTEAQSRARVTHTTYTPNRRFIDNRFSEQIFQNRQLRNYLEEEHIGWDAGHNAVKAVYHALQDYKAYQTYMQAPEVNYEDDKTIWRYIFRDIIPACSAMESALEELELVLDRQNWVTDFNIILSYVIKTIKRFTESSDKNQPLLQMFDSEDELNFGPTLLSCAIEHHDEYTMLIDSHLRNWDANRVASMDRVILEIALAEIMCFPQIAVEVSLNEYIELAKEYSSDKSHLFINGMLDEILREKRRDDPFFKAQLVQE